MYHKNEIQPNAVYTLRDVCRLLDIGEATARRWLATGKLPARRIGRAYRFLGQDLLDLLRVGAPTRPSQGASSIRMVAEPVAVYTVGVRLRRPSVNSEDRDKGQRLAATIRAELAEKETGSLEEAMAQLRGRAWSS